MRRVLRAILHILGRMWVRVFGTAAVALGIVWLAPLFGPLVPLRVVTAVPREAVVHLLSLMASSLLAVTTFSLGVMVSAVIGAAGAATPRANRVMREDPTTQTVLATFLGAFVYCFAALVLLRIEAYSGASVPVVFGFAILAAGMVVVALLRWIEHLTSLGSLDNILDHVTAKAEATLANWWDPPAFGAVPEAPDPQTLPFAVAAETSGVVQYLDLAVLSEAAGRHDLCIGVMARPGDVVLAGDIILRADKPPPEGLASAVQLGIERSFDQDMVYGLAILSEIGERALSPGINDPQTALLVIDRQERLLALHLARGAAARRRRAAAGEAPQHPAIRIAPVAQAALVEAAFGAIARDGAGKVEVVGRLLAALARLERLPDPAAAAAAEAMAARVRGQAAAALTLPDDRARVGAAD
jgi:uncharacterized membrane protein